MNALITVFAAYAIFLIAALSVVVFLRASREQRRFLALCAPIALVIGFALEQAAGMAYSHPRPFVVYHIAPIVPHSNDNSFPSEHTFLSVLMAGLIMLVSRRWGLVLLALAVGVGWARVAAHVHWPVDILGGALIAAIAVVLANEITRRILKRVEAKP